MVDQEAYMAYMAMDSAYESSIGSLANCVKLRFGSKLNPTCQRPSNLTTVLAFGTHRTCGGCKAGR